MTQPIKPTVYSKGPQDDVVEKDVYRESTIEEANSYSEQSAVSVAATDYVSSFSVDSKTLMQDVTDSFGSDEDGITFEFSEAKTRVERSMGIPGSTGSLTNSDKNKIGDTLNTLTGTTDAKIVYRGVDRAINGNDVMSASSITDIVNTISGASDTFEFLDLAAEAAFIKSVTDIAMDWRIPELIDTLIDHSKDAKLKNELMEENAMKAARRGDVQMTDYWCKKMGRGRSREIGEDLIAALIGSFRLQEDETREYSVIANEMLDLFAWIDPLWDKDPYDHNITCMRYYIVASDSSREVIGYTSRASYAAAGKLLRITHSDTIIKNTFPELMDWF